MKNKYGNIYLFLTFLPLALLPLSVPIAILLGIGFLFYGQFYQKQETFKKALNPLMLTFAFAILLGAVQILIQIFMLFGQAIPTIGVNKFVFVMLSIFKILNIILLFVLIFGIICAVKAVISNKKMPFLHKLITILEENQTTEDTAFPEEEIIIEEEK